MAYSGNLGATNSGEGQALQLRLSPTTSGARPAFILAIPGTGFETLPPLAIPTGIFRFLKSLELKPVGLGLTNVPFHGGWKLVEWRPTLGEPEWVRTEIDRICGEIGVEEESGPQIDLNLGLGLPMPDVEPAVEVSGMMSTIVVEEEEDNFLVITYISAEKTTGDQAEGTGTPVSEEAKEEKGEMAVGTGEPVPDVDRSEETPDLMEVDPTVQTGGSIFSETIEAAEGRTDLGAGEGDLRMEDFPQDIFEQMGDLQSEEPTQTPPVSGSKQSSESPSGTEQRRKRIKVLAGRIDLPGVRKPHAPRIKIPSKSAPTRATRKSGRLAAQGTRSSSAKKGPQVIEQISSSSEGSPTQAPARAEEHPETPDLASEQASTEHSPAGTPVPKAALKRKAEEHPTPATHTPAEASAKRPKTEVTPSDKLEKFQKRGVVRGKIVKERYFQDQGLGVFLEKLRKQGWYELFVNTQLGCSQPDIVEFYANVTLHGDVISSTVNGVLIEVNAEALGVILGVPATGFELYVREDKSMVGRDRLLDLSRRLSQQPGLRSPQAVKKGDMKPLHQLLFWFVIKNIIPRAQGRTQADSMDQCLIDLMDKGEPINLPAFMINHIMRIATTTRAHDLGYGFLLTKVFEHFGVELRKKVDAQVIDEIGSSTLMGCGYKLIKAGDPRQDQEETSHAVPAPDRRQNQGVPTPSVPASSASPSQQAVPSPVPDQGLRADLSALQQELKEEKELNAKRHADLLALLLALQPKPSNP